MSTSFLGITFNPYTVARGVFTAIAVMGVGVGINGIASPSSFAEQFGFHTTSTVIKTADANPFIPIACGRALSGVLASLTCLYLKYDKAVGVYLMYGALTGLIDGVMLLRYAGQDSVSAADRDAQKKRAQQTAIGHFVLPGMCAGIGAWLFVNGTNAQ